MRSILRAILTLVLLPSALFAQDVDPDGNEVDWFTGGEVRIGSDGYLSGCPFADGEAQQEGASGNAVYAMDHLDALARTLGPDWERRWKAAQDLFEESRSTTESRGGSFVGPGATPDEPNTPGTALCKTVLDMVNKR